MTSNYQTPGFTIHSENNPRTLPAITFHSTHTLPRPSTTAAAATTATTSRTALPRISMQADPARRPLAVTSINAILNNPIASKDSGLAKQTLKHTAIILPPLKSDSSRRSPTVLPSLSTSTSTSPSTCISHKRKATEDPPIPIFTTTATANPAEISDDDERLHTVDQNCDQIRRKINTLLQSGDMKVGEFVRAIGVNSKSYGSFMKLNGPYKGNSNGTYHNAFAFFKKRELMGIKPAKKAKVSKEQENKLMDLSGIHLEGEEEMEVPVYETCDEIRKKITAFLREPGITQAGFLREIAKSFPDGRNSPQSKVLKDFLSKRGAKAGNTSAVFYGSYVFFEKMRIRDGKPKSQFREEMERIYAGGDSDAEDGPSKRSKRGIDIKRAASGKVWCMKGEKVHEDKYGRLSFH